MHNEFAKCEIKTSVFSGRKSRTGNYCFFVLFLNNALRSWISFLVSILRGAPVEGGRPRLWLAEMSQLLRGSFPFLARLACARRRRRYAEASCFRNAVRTRGVGPLAHQQARGPRGRLTWSRAVKKPGRSCEHELGASGNGRPS